MSFRLINIGIADLKVGTHPDVLRTILGSCVGICLYDPDARIVGMSHIMLAEKNTPEGNPKKYADTAIPLLVEEMVNAGSDTKKLVAKIIGGAMMFKIAENSMMGEIGKSNVRKVKEILQSSGIPLLAEDTGGDFGRTIDFFSEDGSIKVKSLGKPEKLI